MLVLSRKKDEKIVIPEYQITIMVIDIGRDKVRLGITAPKDIAVHRLEVHEANKARLTNPAVEVDHDGTMIVDIPLEEISTEEPASGPLHRKVKARQGRRPKKKK